MIGGERVKFRFLIFEEKKQKKERLERLKALKRVQRNKILKKLSRTKGRLLKNIENVRGYNAQGFYLSKLFEQVGC